MVDRPSEPYGQDRQRDVYATGMLADQPPEYPVRYERLREAALEAMSDEAAAYVGGGAGGERTMDANRRSFADWRLLPRLLRDVSERDLHVDLLGRTLDVPFALAPVGIQTIVHEEGELATARAAHETDVPMCLSSVASQPMEAVAEELGETPKWFQLYWSSEPAIMESFVGRAEDAGFDAVVLTVDVPILGWRERDIERGYLPMLAGEGMANYFSDPAFRALLDVDPEENPELATQRFLDVFGNPALDWTDLEDLCAMTDLPVVVKGLLHPDDAERAVECGVDAVAVSNHGGRQVDTAVGALEALPGIVEQVMGRVPVTVDGGVRRGADVVTALALGADAVMVGRPYVYGLALGGQSGVEAVLENLRADLDLTLANVGRPSVAEVDESLVVRADRL
ncbi:alpha-hydroxy-acid oxidizing protein [Halomarina ordinaria]|uniref:Alpha-hydroxy-acid oxidizing protein n=1 Tax=Halomarina ordinaria TaxID=3033939 RepID=A0ABD5U6H1_9EURY|nr:alpha-hydroxy-acid oxidizing protein [Halomarina sp. PSRA2]